MHKNILVVDDDSYTLDLLKFFLEQAGYNVRTCKDGYTAIEEIANHTFNAVVLDIAMPHMNGMRTLKNIRGNTLTQDLPVIMLTSSLDKSDVILAKKNNVTEYLVKPPNREVFLKRIELVLNSSPQFTEIKFSENVAEAKGYFSLPFQLKSISVNGFILTGSAALAKDATIQIHDFQFFKTLKLKKTEFKVTACVLKEEGQYEYYIAFLGTSKSELDVIREWILNESIKQKNNKIYVA